ncbi:sulfite exporter TauE/SafE family protein [Oceanobacillus senegalensis]|uniref:sulfite exporter TauE/SafE family protein n=1 Tax=Oceanobacillus senegalensis TaxID=1936063 RepID=UPI000A3095B1|nr:sulfite exporter TauE/SafE family protein [Oceanobacillus senegalensis]
MVFIICLLIGFATAFVGSIAGLGGGVILVPSLFIMQSISDSFAWATPQTIVGISLITMIFTALSSTISYLKAKRVDYHTGFLFLLGSIPGGIIGSWFNAYIKVDAFLLCFGILMIFVSLLLLIKKDSLRKEVDPNVNGVRTFTLLGEEYRYRVSNVPAFLLALVVGMLSGLFGIGGGSVMVPAMILLFGIPTHIATATSMFMIFFVSISGSITHIALGHIAWEYVFVFIPGAWIGGKLGAKVNQMLPGSWLEWVLRIVLILVGIRMIFQGLT